MGSEPVAERVHISCTFSNTGTNGPAYVTHLEVSVVFFFLIYGLQLDGQHFTMYFHYTHSQEK